MSSGQGQERDGAQQERGVMLGAAAGLAAVGIGIIILGPWGLGAAVLVAAVAMGIVFALR